MTKLYSKEQAFNKLVELANNYELDNYRSMSDDFSNSIHVEIITRHEKQILESLYIIWHSKSSDKFIYDKKDKLFVKANSLKLSKSDYQKCSKFYKDLTNLPKDECKHVIDKTKYNNLYSFLHNHCDLNINNADVNDELHDDLFNFSPKNNITTAEDDYKNYHKKGLNPALNLMRKLRLILLSSKIVK